jgi:hypothetical protein
MSEDTVTPRWTLTRVSQIDGENLSLTLDGDGAPKVEITPEGKTTFNTSLTVVGAVTMEAAATARAGLTVDNKLTVNGSAKATGTLAADQGLTGLGAVPVGAILLWSGDPAKLPAGWLLCNGGGWLANGDPVPDLRSSFIVGHDPRSDDYKLVHNRGGAATRVLKAANLPKEELLNLKQFIAARPIIDGDTYGLSRSAGRDVEVGSKGMSEPFDIRPPWYALAYIIYAGHGAVVSANPKMRAALRNGESLKRGEGVVSPSARYTLLFEATGKLVLLDNLDPLKPRRLWVAQQNGSDSVGDTAIQQADSNFVMYTASGAVAFASDTYKKSGILLRVTNDGKVSIDGADGKPVWSMP